MSTLLSFVLSNFKSCSRSKTFSSSFSLKIVIFLLTSFLLVGCDNSKVPNTEDTSKSSDQSAADSTSSDPEKSDTEKPAEPTGKPEKEGEDASKPKAGVTLTANDVSILFPPPKTVDDMAFQISIADLNATAFPDAVFANMEEIATGSAGKVTVGEGQDFQVKFTSNNIDLLGKKAFWHISGIRIDPSAPGLSGDIRKNFGTIPQIRLVLSPVTGIKEEPVVHDFALHLVYSFIKAPAEGCEGVACRMPDTEAFKSITNDIKQLKSDLLAGSIGGTEIVTDGDLGVHPALANPKTRLETKARIQEFLNKHLSAKRLGAIAVMGLDSGVEPWIFLAMKFEPKVGKYVSVPSPAISQPPEVLKKIKEEKDPKKLSEVMKELNSAQMLSFVTELNVLPVPVTSNVNPTPCLVSDSTCQNVSTAELFSKDRDVAKNHVRAVVDVVADASKAHFFNTDCVSCHTETHREIALLGTQSFEGISDDVLPNGQWNVRNFGWFRSEFVQADVVPTVTRRTQAETEEVVKCVNDLDNCFDNVDFHLAK